jgi:hypothetical protein
MSTPRSAGRASTAVAVVLAMLLGGCITGQRPHFADDQPTVAETGNPAIDDVLARLDVAQFATFTADYEILTRLGDQRSTATVVQDDDGRRSTTVNDIRFIANDGQPLTCDLSAGGCEPSMNDARISDVGITHRFYGDDFARRLRVDANRRIGEPIGYEMTQAGRSALCVDVPVSGGTKSYCAIAEGPLARYDGNDFHIELVGYSDVPDLTAFETS